MANLRWAVFLAVSWTWCIGMYLPSLLMHDGGAPFFFAFLIPNVVGAASVGWVLSNRERGRRFVEHLRTPMLWFTAVTVAFQVFFLAWKSTEYARDGFAHAGAGMLAGLLIVGGVAAVRRRVDWVPALATLACSGLAAVALLSDPASEPAREPLAAVGGLAMITCLGFGLCPYLDLSFNRAVQHAPSPRRAFTIGFFVIFAVTILAVTRGRALWSPAEPVFELSAAGLYGATGLHFGAQIAFTILAHAAALRVTRTDGSIDGLGRAEPDTPGGQSSPSIVPWVVLPGLLGLLIGAVVDWLPEAYLPGFTSSISAGVLAYRLFLGFYGLIFPAWMLLALRAPAMSRATLGWLLAVCVVAGPFMWVGAVGRDELWLYPGVGIVLLAGAIRFITATGSARTVRRQVAEGQP